MKESGRRITFRLDPTLAGLLDRRCQETHSDISAVIRVGLARYLNGDQERAEAQGIAANRVIPPEVFALCAPFRASSADLRVELKGPFLELFALSLVAAQHWSRAKGVREIHQGLLDLHQYVVTLPGRQT